MFDSLYPFGDLLRAVASLQLVIAVIGITVVMCLKKMYYVMHRLDITLAGLGLIGICAANASGIYEKIGTPCSWRIGVIWLSTAMLDIAILHGFWKSRLLPLQHRSTKTPSPPEAK